MTVPMDVIGDGMIEPDIIIHAKAWGQQFVTQSQHEAVSFATMLKFVLLYMVLPLVGLFAVYIFRLNSAMLRQDEEMYKLSPNRFTPERVKQAYARVEKDDREGRGLDHIKSKLPAQAERRYVITGGSGLVGTELLLQLLMREHPVQGIRILDIRKPFGPDVEESDIPKIEWIKTDITDPSSVKAAFSAPWASDVAKWPLTVIHSAASINIAHRSKGNYPKTAKINVDGTRVVMNAAKTAGCSAFIGIASGSIGVRPTHLWSWDVLLKGRLPYWAQILNEDDSEKPLREHEEFFSNYAVSKAVAERLVLAANRPGFATGVIRPTNGIYGSPRDPAVGVYIRAEVLPTYQKPVIQSFVSAATVCLGVWQLESALVSPKYNSKVAGNTFVVTDPNPAPSFADIYELLGTVLVTPFRIVDIPPGPVLLVCYLASWYSNLLITFPFLINLGLKPLQGDFAQMAPSIFSITNYHVADDRKARKPLSEGGLGMQELLGDGRGMNTIDMMCRQVLDHNKRFLAKQGKTDARRGQEVHKPIKEELRNVAASAAGEA